MIDDLVLDALRRIPRISYYFRYPLQRHDFHALSVRDELKGHYAAKPLYGRLTPKGRVDRSSDYNGDIAALFVPVDAGSAADASVYLTHIAPEHVVFPTGDRNWPAIREAAEDCICNALAR